jgi:hypothetical protein
MHITSRLGKLLLSPPYGPLLYQEVPKGILMLLFREILLLRLLSLVTLLERLFMLSLKSFSHLMLFQEKPLPPSLPPALKLL